MLLVTRYGNVSLPESAVTRLSQLTGCKQDPAFIVLLSDMVERLVQITETDAPPVLLDADVFLAQVLAADTGDLQVQPELLLKLVEAWKVAEGSLKKDARVALRLLDKVLQEVMRSANRDAFAKWFKSATGHVTDAQGMYLRMYLDRLTEWTLAGKAETGEDPHYLVNVLKSVFERHLNSAACNKKGKAYSQRRVQVARSALDDHFFA